MAGLVPFNRSKPSIRPTGLGTFYNMLDDFFNDSLLPFPARNLMTDTFKVDVRDDEKAYLIEADLPGVNKEELNLEFNDGKLTIHVTREEKKEEEKNNYIHRERRCTTMQRSIFLEDARADGVEAKLEDGVLKINVPKMEKVVNSVKIDVK